MKVNFDDKKRTFKSLDGEVMRQSRLDVLAIVRASEIARRRILDVKQAALILEEKGIKLSSLFDDIGKPVTLKGICVDVLNPPETSERGERKEGGDNRYKKFQLIRRIYGSDGDVSFKTDEIALIKNLIAKSTYSNIILGQAFDWLEGEEEETKDK